MNHEIDRRRNTMNELRGRKEGRAIFFFFKLRIRIRVNSTVEVRKPDATKETEL